MGTKLISAYTNNVKNNQNKENIGKDYLVRERSISNSHYSAKYRSHSPLINYNKERKKAIFETDVNQIHLKINVQIDNRSNINHIYKNIFETRSSIRNNAINLLSNEDDLEPISSLERRQIKEKRIERGKIQIPQLMNKTSPFDLPTSLETTDSDAKFIESSGNSITPVINQNINPNSTNLENLQFDTDTNNLKDTTSTTTNSSMKINMKDLFKDFESNLINSEKIRNQYYSKLILNNIWEMEKKNHNTIFIFDWDDTILATNYISPNGYVNCNYTFKPHDYIIFKDLDKAAYQLLTLAIEKGKTFIVTNAMSGWVETSAKIFLPEVSTLLDKLTIISARRSFENYFPGNSRQWKIETFNKIQKCFKPNLVTNLICIGDSIIEMEAAHIISKKFENMHLKTIKFIEKPKPEEVIKELKLIIKNFDLIFSSVKGLTIQVLEKFFEKGLKSKKIISKK